jgi:hypothetical protein
MTNDLFTILKSREAKAKAGTATMIKQSSGITLTLREALAIQEKQLAHYSPRFPELRAAATAATNVEGLDLDESMPVSEVNKLVPRGCFLGYLIGESF